MRDELILSVKMQNALEKEAEKHGYNLEYNIKNISINGSKRGCSGFVTNTANGSCVYFTTDLSCFSHLGFMYRYADNDKDYKGYLNRWTGLNDDRRPLTVLAESIVNLLGKTPKEANDRRI